MYVLLFYLFKILLEKLFLCVCYPSSKKGRLKKIFIENKFHEFSKKFKKKTPKSYSKISTQVIIKILVSTFVQKISRRYFAFFFFNKKKEVPNPKIFFFLKIGVQFLFYLMIYLPQVIIKNNFEQKKLRKFF